MSGRLETRPVAAARAARAVAAFALLALLVPAAPEAVHAAAPPATGAPWLATPVQRTLANGLRVAVLPDPRLGIIQIQLAVPAGLTAEPRGAEGVAWVASEMLRHGTTSRDPITFDQEVEATGGSITSSVGRDFATQNGLFLARDFEAGMELMSDAVTYPIFDDGELQKVKSQTVRQLAQTQQTANGAAEDQIWQRLWGEHPYARDVYGTYSGLLALDGAAVRSFWTQRYRPDGATLAIAGDITPERAFAVAEEWFGHWSGRADAAPAPAAPAAPERAIVRILDRPGRRAELRVATLAPPRGASDELAVLAAASLFGGAPASRPAGERTLFGRELRVSYAPLGAGGTFSAAVSAPADSAGDAVRALLADLTALAAPAPADLDGVKRVMKGVFPMSLETLGQRTSGWLAADRYGLDASWAARYESRVDALRADDVAAAAKRWLDPAHAVVVAVGPAAALRAQLAPFGTVEVVTDSLAFAAADSAAVASRPPAPPAPKVTAEQRTRGRTLLGKLVTAHGGAAAVRAVRDSRVEAVARVYVGTQELSGDLVQARREPDAMVYITELGGFASRQTLKNGTAWQVTAADSVPRDLDPQTTEGLKSGFSSDLHHLLLAALDPKTSAWYSGREQIDTVKALAVVVEAPGMPSRTYYLHPVSYRLIAFDQGERRGASALSARRKLSDFRKVGGILWPYHEVRLLNGETVMEVDVKRVRFNTGINDMAFEKPAAGAR